MLRLKKHQVLLRLGHPIMRQAMATLCRQLHDPTATTPSTAGPWRRCTAPASRPCLVFHYTVTAINELREPLHDEVFSTRLPHRGRPAGSCGGRLRAERAGERVPPDQVASQAGRLGPQLSGPLVRSTAANWKSSP